VKRTPQTAAKRAREQAVREKRERKAARKRDAALERRETESGSDLHDDIRGHVIGPAEPVLLPFARSDG